MTMRRRGFLLAGSSAGLLCVPARIASSASTARPRPRAPNPDLAGWSGVSAETLSGLAPLARFAAQGERWSVFERRDETGGTLWFVSPGGRMLALPRRLESCAAPDGPFYAGLDFATVALSGPDLLADHLLSHCDDPDPDAVRRIAPPVASHADPATYGPRLLWTFFLATRAGSDTMPVTPAGSTRNWHVDQAIPGLTNDSAMVARRCEGLLGGWMPALVKSFPDGPGRFWELMLFARTDQDGPPVTPTLQRVCRIEHGQVTSTRFYGTYPGFGNQARSTGADGFYAALLHFVLSWQDEFPAGTTMRLPDPSWPDMARHAFVRELMTRPGGTYPRYGAVDRDYVGSEYDGFQDSFTSSLLANLEWGRFAQARAVLDGFLTDFVGDDGLVRMRGTEVGQTGLGLSLIARHARLTGDLGLLRRHSTRIGAMAALLVALHDRSLALPDSDPGHGLLSGWSESDSCLFPDPSVWWRPYFGNSALAAAGLSDLAAIWPTIDPSGTVQAGDWQRRGAALAVRLADSLRASILHGHDPPYVPILPGDPETFRESLARHHPSPQQWAHRVYAELLQSGVLPRDLEGMVIDSMRAHGATSLGVVANIAPPDPGSRDMLGFVSYGYAKALLRQERIPEYLLFLYAHRHRLHTPGSWTAAEVAGLRGELPLFCIPAQLTIPILLRWMLVQEDDSADILYLARAVPRRWLEPSRFLSIDDAPTRFGPVGFSLRAEAGQVVAELRLPAGRPIEILLSVRCPRGKIATGLVLSGAVGELTSGRDSAVVRLHGQGTVTARIALSPRA